MSGARSLEEQLQLMVNYGQILIPFEAIELMRLDESGEHFLLYSVCYEGKIGWDVRMNFLGTDMEGIVAERRISLIPAINEEPDFPVTDLVHHYNISSILMMPIASVNQMWGFLNFYHRKPNVFQQQHMEIGQFFCALLAFSFDNLIMHQKLAYFKGATKEIHEADYAISIYFREEMKVTQDRIIEKCMAFNEKGMAKLTTRQQEVIKDIKELAELEQRRIDHLNEYLLLSGGQVYLERKKVDIGRSILDAVEKAKLKLDSKGLRTLIEIDKKFPPVIADYKKLQRILSAIIENAIEASKPTGVIRFFVSEEKGNAVVEITNFSDEVILPSDFDNIFTPFGRLEHSLSKKKGKLILNLPVIKLLVEMSDGKIWVESDKEEGTTFFFSLPAAR